MRKVMIITILFNLTFVLILFVANVDAFDPEAASQVSKGIAEWKLMNEDKGETQVEPTVYVSSSLSGMVGKGGKAVGVVRGLAAFENNKPYDFLDYINKPTDDWYGVDSMGMPGGWGAIPRAGEKIYINIDDPFTYLPTARNITPIPTHRSTIDPMYRGESGFGVTFVHIEWGSGISQKIYGTGGHSLKSYEQMAGPIRPGTIRGHSMSNLYLDSLYRTGGWQNIKIFQGKTVLGAGHSPIDVGKNQIATGGYWSSFPGDVITRAAPSNMGLPFRNPLKMEAEILRATNLGTRIGTTPYGTGTSLGSIPPIRMEPSAGQWCSGTWSTVVNSPRTYGTGTSLGSIPPLRITPSPLPSSGIGSWGSGGVGSNWNVPKTNWNILKTNWNIPKNNWNQRY